MKKTRALAVAKVPPASTIFTNLAHAHALAQALSLLPLEL